MHISEAHSSLRVHTAHPITAHKDRNGVLVENTCLRVHCVADPEIVLQAVIELDDVGR